MYAISTALRNAIDAGKPQRILLEFPNNVTFSNEDVAITDGVTYTEMFTSEDDICIGSCPSASIEFSLLNDEGQLANFTFGQFKAWLGARIDSGTATGKTKTFTEGGASRTYEFAPLGVFTAERPDVIKKAKVAVTANDRMVLFDKTMPSATNLSITYPTTIGALLSAMCTYLGVTLATQTFTNSDLAIASEPSQFKNATMREVLSWIAEAACAIARFNRDGNIEIVWYSTVQKTFSESGYSEFTPAWFQTEAITGTHIRNGNSNATLDLGTATNVYVIQDNPFLRQNDTSTRSRATPTAEEAINTKLQTAPQYHPYNASLFTDWTLQSGDVVTVTSDSESYTAPIHNMSLKWFGAPKVEISAAGNPKREVQDEEARKEYEAENERYNNSRLIFEAEEQIVLKVSKGNVATQLAIECGNVSISGGNLNVDGYVKADQLASEIGDIATLTVQDITAGQINCDGVEAGTLQANTDLTSAGTLNVSGTSTLADVDAQDVSVSTLNIDGYDIDPANLVASFGTNTGSGGQISIPVYMADGSEGTPITFNIADTQFYRDAVISAYNNGVADGTPDNVSISTAASAPTAAGNYQYSTVTIITEKNGETVNTYTGKLVNVTAPYNTGAASVTLTGSWNTSTRTYTATASNGQTVSTTLGVTYVYPRGNSVTLSNYTRVSVTVPNQSHRVPVSWTLRTIVDEDGYVWRNVATGITWGNLWDTKTSYYFDDDGTESTYYQGASRQTYYTIPS